MFEKLKDAFRRLRESLATKEVSGGELEDVLDELKLSLIESEVAFEAAEELANKLVGEMAGARVPRSLGVKPLVVDSLKRVLLEALKPLESPPLESIVREHREARPGTPYVMVFLGVNGTGKTTSIAKIAYRLKTAGLRVVLAASDTYRAGAIEQLRRHAERLKVDFISQRYGADPAAVARDAVDHAVAKRLDVVLIDTAGRMHTKRNLMDELNKIIRVSEANERVVVIDALAGNDSVTQALEFDRFVGVDSIVIAKMDADVKGGALISVAYMLRRPIRYLGVGQGYKDLREFKPEWVIENLLPP